MSWTVAIPLAVILIAIAVAVMSRSRAIASANGVLRDLHSRPSYHGVYSFLWTFLIGLAVFTGLYFASAQYIDADLTALVQANKPDSIRIEQQLIVSDAIAIAEGGVASQNDELRQLVAARYAELAQLRVYGIAALA
ncbi:MAG: phosphate ABC transporter permease family protein, partial [Pseudomonadota bacterium]